MFFYDGITGKELRWYTGIQYALTRIYCSQCVIKIKHVCLFYVCMCVTKLCKVFLSVYNEFFPTGDPTVFGNLKPCKEITSAVISSLVSMRHNGYAPSTGECHIPPFFYFYFITKLKASNFVFYYFHPLLLCTHLIKHSTASH